VHSAQLHRAMSILAIAVGLLVLVGGLLIRVNDLRLQVVLTGSMRPAISPGDLVITAPTPADRLVVGDVIAFYPPDGSAPVLHRITTLERDAAGTTITTRGDANSVDDDWRATLRGPTGYRLIGAVPYIGWLKELRGLPLIAGGLLVALVLVREFRRRESPWPSGPRQA
jgi:signal peptidase I